MLGWKHPLLCKVSKMSLPHIEGLAEKVGVSSETQQISDSSSQAPEEHWLQNQRSTLIV